MSSKTLKKNAQKLTGSQPGWDAAISDAEKRIGELKVRIGQLKAAIRIFRENKESGEPFPGEGKKQDSER